MQENAGRARVVFIGDSITQGWEGSGKEVWAKYYARRHALNLGIGSDLCQDHPDSVVTWMRNGRWTKTLDYGEGSAANAGFPPQPAWFRDNRDFPNLAVGLRKVGFSDNETNALMGENWLGFFDANFGPKA